MSKKQRSLSAEARLFLLFTAFFYAFSSFASASYFVAGDVVQQNQQTQNWTEYAATPENTTATNVTLTAVTGNFTTGIQGSGTGGANQTLNSTQALAIKLVYQNPQFQHNLLFPRGRTVTSGVIRTNPSSDGLVQMELVVDNGNSPTGAVVARGWNTSVLVGLASNPNGDNINLSNYSITAGTYWLRANVSAGAVYLTQGGANITFAICNATFSSCVIYNSTTFAPSLMLISPSFATSPLISSANDSRTLDFAVFRDSTFRSQISAQFQGTTNKTSFPVYTVDAVVNRTDTPTNTRWGLQDDGGGWAAGFNDAGTGTANELKCEGEGGVASAAFIAPSLTTRHNYTVKVMPASVECYVDGTLYATVAHTNGNVKWFPYAASPDAATNVSQYSSRFENILPSNAVINVLANGSGNYTYSQAYSVAVPVGGMDFFTSNNSNSGSPSFTANSGWNPTGNDDAAGSGTITWKFSAPLGWNFTSFSSAIGVLCSNVPTARNCTFSKSTDGVTYSVYSSPNNDGVFSNSSVAINSKEGYIRVFGQQVGSGWRPTITSFSFSGLLANTSATSLPVLVPGNNTLTITQSDNASNQANFTYSRNETSGSVQYSPQLLESQSFTANQINLVPNTTTNYVSNIYYSNLYYDGVKYLAATCTPLNCTRSLQANASQTNTTHSFYWYVNVSFPNGNWTFTRQNETYNQYVYQVNATNCSLGGNTTLNFTTKEEENSTSILASQNVNLDLRTPDGTINRSTQYNASNSQNLTICLPPTATQLYADSFQNYFANGYNTRYYFLRNASLNATMQIIPLYLENSVQAQQTEITLTDQNSQPLPGYYIRISRYFPSENAYRHVAMILTAENGKASVPLRTNDQFYQFTIMNSTSVVTTFSQQNVPCNPAATLCTITIKVPIGQTTLALYQILGSATTACTTTNTSVSCTVADTSGLVRNWTLNLIRSAITGYTTVCTNSITTTSGSLYCNTTLAYAARDHHYTLQADYNPSTQVNAGTLQKAFSTTWGTDGLLASFFLIIALIGIGIWNPAVSVILGLLGFIISFWLGWMPVPIGALVGIAIVLLLFAYKMKT